MANQPQKKGGVKADTVKKTVSKVSKSAEAIKGAARMDTKLEAEEDKVKQYKEKISSLEKKSDEAVERAVRMDDEVKAKEKKIRELKEKASSLEKKTAEAVERADRMDAEVKAKEKKIKELKEKTCINLFRKKAKKFLLIFPRVFNSIGKCQTLKKVRIQGEGFCPKGLNMGKKGLAEGAKFISSITGNIPGNVRSKLRLQIIRKGIQDTFHQMGTKACELNFKGEKNVIQDELIRKLINRVKEYEKEIEMIESDLIVTDKSEPKVKTV